MASEGWIRTIGQLLLQITPGSGKLYQLVISLPIPREGSGSLGAWTLKFVCNRSTSDILPVQNDSHLSVANLIPPSRRAIRVHTFFLNMLKGRVRGNLRRCLFHFQRMDKRIARRPFNCLMRKLPKGELGILEGELVHLTLPRFSNWCLVNVRHRFPIHLILQVSRVTRCNSRRASHQEAARGRDVVKSSVMVMPIKQVLFLVN